MPYAILARLLPTVAALIGDATGRLPHGAETPVPIGDPSARTIGTVHFGGPDLPAGTLRALLLARVAATPPGEAIDWATYYFLDAELAGALIAASDRGVRVRLVVEGDPRLRAANGGVLARLTGHGLRGGLTVRRPLPGPFAKLGGKLHAKIYAFSWPRPHALVGSYNPSGGATVDAATLAAIGDQDRGHNLLVEITGPALVAELVAHVARLAANGGAMGRRDPRQNRIPQEGGTALLFYPRRDPAVAERAIAALGPGDALLAAVSHLKSAMVAVLARAAARGATIRLVVHDTERRVPQAAVDRLSAAGAVVRRFAHPSGYPMHAKFLLVERPGETIAWFGSLNFNRNSRLLNDELLVRSDDPALVGSLRARFAIIAAQAC